MESVWRKSVKMPRFAPLGGDIKTDVLVIGGGLAGILCAYQLSQAGVDCVLVEQGALCRGVTGNTTAKITAQHGLIYDKLLRQFGVEKARLYLEANLDALARYRDLSRSIDCDFEERDSFVYALNGRETLEREREALPLCGSCPFRRICNGGCQRMRREICYSSTDSTCGHRLLLEKLMPRLQAVAASQRGYR